MVKGRLHAWLFGVAALSVVSLVIHAGVLRPRLWPAGAGLTLSGSAVAGALAEAAVVSVPRPPEVGNLGGLPVRVARVWPGGAADRAGLTPGLLVTAVADETGRRVELGERLPGSGAGVLRVWREMQSLAVTGPVTLWLRDEGSGAERMVSLDRPAVWSLDDETVIAWLRADHFVPLSKHLAYTLAALLLLMLGTRGLTAHLMTMAFLLMAGSDTGPLIGAEPSIPVLGSLLVGYTWVVLPVAFPVIGLAVLYFPSRAPLLDVKPWIVPALFLVSLPMAGVGALSALFLQGVDGVMPVLAWVAARPWVFNLSFGLGLAANMLLIGEGLHRYKTNPDAAERRRIQTVVVTGVPGAFAYGLATGIPLLAGMLGVPFRWPLPIAMGLHVLLLLSAFGVSYAVAFRRALSPRTVLRQGVRYAMARRTLHVLLALPGVLLAISLYKHRTEPLATIISGQPLFYLTAFVFMSLALRFRDRAFRKLDRKFFRTDYDAREILVGLATRVANESDPRALAALVAGDLNTAIQPESVSVVADSGQAFEAIHAIGPPPPPIRSSSGLAQLLQWSDTPLEVFLDDARSPAGRLPTADRDWLRQTGAALLVPVFSGSGPDRPLVGAIVLGAKRSEESFTAEDRRLLAGVAAQMGLALDLSRLRLAVATPRRPSEVAATRLAAFAGRQAVEPGVVLDGKYRIDALIGRGGMGAVYRARDLRIDRDVAVKVVRGELLASAGATERFRREAQLAGRLQHPAVVTVFDVGTLDDGEAYLVMEFVRGEDLRSRLSRGPLPPDEAVRLLRWIAAGVEAAHRQSILHRDLKPENVLLPDGGGVKVLDFGVARLMPAVGDGTVTAGATIIGTPAYMAPEQLRGEAVDARSDIYSLAVMGYEMLTGHLPFGKGSFVDVAMRQASGRDGLELKDVPPAVAAVFREALAYERERRPFSASALAAEVARAVGADPEVPA